jgi:peptidoglycan hydrolase-like protein with peptidoglycan-binding domain
VRNHAGRTNRGRDAEVDEDLERRPGLFRALGWGARDTVGFLFGGFAVIAILVNVLFLQTGTHPAPMFKSAPSPAAVAAAKPVAVAETPTATVTVPRPRPAEAAPAKAPAPTPRAPGEIITDIQRELARRGFYDGAVDGLYGPKTDGAIRDFEQLAGLKPSSEPNEALLQAIVRSPAKVAKATGAAAPPARTTVVRPPEAVPDRPAPSRRVVALQRALAEYGYGQIKPTGIVDSETQAAIEKFERERRLPITGQPSERVTRELASMIGRPLE